MSAAVTPASSAKGLVVVAPVGPRASGALVEVEAGGVVVGLVGG